ncbi:MAG: hypothetical protein HDS14_06195 [Bacteroides sp.]|nr:hypothetical protein [Bacteroides sp.]
MRVFIVILAGLLTHLYAAAGVNQYSWWFDAIPETTLQNRELTSSSLKLDIDASQLEPGVHTLHLLVRDEDGKQSSVVARPFVRVIDPRNSVAYVCIDGELRDILTQNSGNGLFETNLELSDLDTGLHTILTFVNDGSGHLSGVKEGVFLRVPSAAEIGELKCYYAIDNDEGHLYKGGLSGNILHADLDVSHLTDGLHSITFMLINSIGQMTQSITSHFLKFPLGGINIAGYSYWLNDLMDKRVNVDIKQPSNPYTLTALLPLEKQPFRSSSFHFDVENGEPTLYTQNDFNLMIRDSRGFFSITSFPYYDASSRRLIKDEIKPFTQSRENVAHIAKNQVSWYSFDAQKGDSISFRTDATCTFDIFAPDGTLLFRSTADKSRIGTGAHTPLTGTHYIALHDELNASSGSGFYAYLTKIDKFAVLNLSPVNMSKDADLIVFDFEGNGLDRLKRVEITGSDDKSVRKPTDFKSADWSFGMASFDFSEKPLSAGQYHLNFYFDDEGKEELVSESFTVQPELQLEDLQVSVRPNNTSIAEVRDIEVCIYNPSNIGLWGVPFCVARTSTDPNMAFKFNLLAAPEAQGWEDPLYYDTENLLGMGIKGRYLPMIIPYIGPKETLTYTFSIPRKIENTFDFYAWCGEPWSREVRDSSGDMVAKRMSQVQLDRNYNRLTTLQNIANQAGGAAGGRVATGVTMGNVAVSTGCAIAGVYAGLDARRREAYNEAYPGFDDLVGDAMPRYRIPTGMTPAAILNNAGILPFNVPDGANPGTCCQQQAEISNPRPNRTNVQFPASVDPNDLIGYQSESGSKYIGKAVKEIDYTVEFENDPEFATASALSIHIVNRLDGKVFDLASFEPKELKIGKKTLSFEETDATIITQTASSRVATLDMRPEINGIAQIKLNYDSSTGVIDLMMETLNPYTMEVSDDVTRGILPVNMDGSGLGEFCYGIALKSGLANKTTISNRATIIFDSNDPIDTPAWENITDFISPVSAILSVATEDDRTFNFEFEGSDEDSGLWRYDLYMLRAGDADWTLVKEGITDNSYSHTFVDPVVGARFLTVAVDHAGNREETEISDTLKGDVDSNGAVDSNDLVLLYNYYVGRPVTIDLEAADINNDGRIDSQDAVGVQKIYLGQTLPRGIVRKLVNFRKR